MSARDPQRWVGFLLWGVIAFFVWLLARTEITRNTELQFIMVWTIMSAIGLWSAPTKGSK